MNEEIGRSRERRWEGEKEGEEKGARRRGSGGEGGGEGKGQEEEKKWRKGTSTRYDFNKVNGMLSLKMKMEMKGVRGRGLYQYSFVNCVYGLGVS